MLSSTGTVQAKKSRTIVKQHHSFFNNTNMDEILNAANLLSTLRGPNEQRNELIQTPAASIAAPAGVQPRSPAVASAITRSRKMVLAAKAEKTKSWKRGCKDKLTGAELAVRKEHEQTDILRRRANRAESARLRKLGDLHAICAHVKECMQKQLRDESRKTLSSVARTMLVGDAARVKAGEGGGDAASYGLACAKLFVARDVVRKKEAVISEGVVVPTPELLQKLADMKELCVLAERIDVVAMARGVLGL